ncbi:hypothetical protein PTSG_13258 [Salpingoeca rosetta]|uniref:Uncharacterized protein n=1 Tax=Salpingoeca rosetta (strain ATCC 50818 / BSB-021) TaxID=946362 RepID=F2UG90_SALR5|nr:uncharacterized protein PTSG_13258 [Salpingoeca rosetta]EGD75640.1 hypothetical protein PTSG_13258 [Salpingoeca rosetta]|eukprot:XP_004991561.1 hypothetical protein PTSG_13258 [Salpingoeca rosetta]
MPTAAAATSPIQLPLLCSCSVPMCLSEKQLWTHTSMVMVDTSNHSDAVMCSSSAIITIAIDCTAAITLRPTPAPIWREADIARVSRSDEEMVCGTLLFAQGAPSTRACARLSASAQARSWCSAKRAGGVCLDYSRTQACRLRHCHAGPPAAFIQNARSTAAQSRHHCARKRHHNHKRARPHHIHVQTHQRDPFCWPP